ncbi:hypothetical protein [uncultured Kordia sp.]|uniref:hypothetical protein n=1 Tax=uncultured Kordia sp. TaxID=507699 RepID=UPI00260D99CA|nr:hypothetical protein [uncultured Kordia sp.]
MTPHIRNQYLIKDTVNFEYNYWTFFFIGAGIIYVLILIRALIIEKCTKKNVRVEVIFSIFPALFLAFLLDGFIERTVLYTNTFYLSENIQQDYKVKRDKRLHLLSNDGFIIIRQKELSSIETIRKEKNLPSIYDLKDGDTIRVDFAKGYLDIKYLK